MGERDGYGQRNAQPGLTKINRTHQLTVNVRTVRMAAVLSLLSFGGGCLQHSCGNTWLVSGAIMRGWSLRGERGSRIIPGMVGLAVSIMEYGGQFKKETMSWKQIPEKSPHCDCDIVLSKCQTILKGLYHHFLN